MPGMKRRLFENPHMTAQLSGHLAGKPPAMRGAFAMPPSGAVTLARPATAAPARFAQLPTVTLPAKAPAGPRLAALLSAVRGQTTASAPTAQQTPPPQARGAQLLAAVARFGTCAGHEVVNVVPGGKRPKTLEEADEATKDLFPKRKSLLEQAVEAISKGR